MSVLTIPDSYNERPGFRKEENPCCPERRSKTTKTESYQGEKEKEAGNAETKGNSLLVGSFLNIFGCLPIFFQAESFQKIRSGIPSDFQTV